jgi:hypothetical protein
VEIGTCDKKEELLEQGLKSIFIVLKSKPRLKIVAAPPKKSPSFGPIDDAYCRQR